MTTALPRDSAMRDSTGDEIGFEILRALRKILRQVSKHSRKLGKQAGMTVPQLMCLKAIAEANEPVSLAQLSARVQLSPSTSSGIVERLVRAGLLLRERGARDRRVVQLSLTELGTTRLNQFPTPLQERFLERLAGLDPTERQALFEALERIVELMEATDLDAAPLLTPEPEM